MPRFSQVEFDFWPNDNYRSLRIILISLLATINNIARHFDLNDDLQVLKIQIEQSLVLLGGRINPN
jgi:hypothetical protein